MSLHSLSMISVLGDACSDSRKGPSALRDIAMSISVGSDTVLGFQLGILNVLTEATKAGVAVWGH